MNIPIYRAKKIDSDEWVEGYLTQWFTEKRKYSIENFSLYSTDSLTIDPNTLAIHFPNMIDKNGKKIFASLSENGVGGDCCINTIVMSMLKDDTKLFNSALKHPFIFTVNGIYSGGICHLNKINNFGEYQVIGIHKGE